MLARTVITHFICLFCETLHVIVRSLRSIGIVAHTHNVERRSLRLETLDRRELMASDLTFGQVPTDMTTDAYVFIGDHSGSNTEKWSMNIGGFSFGSGVSGAVLRETVIFENGQSYGVSVSHDSTTRKDPKTGEDKPDYDYRAWIDHYANPTWKSGSPTPSGPDFFVTDPSGLLQRRYLAEDGQSNPVSGKFALLHFPLADLDVDSNNDDSRGGNDDWIEGDRSQGKSITILKGDSDEDGKPDNYDFDGVKNANFEPVTLRLSSNLGYVANPASIQVRFTFDGAAHSETPSTTGLFRLWTVDADADRTSQSTFITAGTAYSAAQLGLSSGSSKTFYLEAVNPTQRTIYFDPIKVDVMVNGNWQGNLTDLIHVRGVETNGEAFLQSNFVSADDVKAKATYQFLGDDLTKAEGESVKFELLDASGQPTGVTKDAIIKDGLAFAELSLPSNETGEIFKVRVKHKDVTVQAGTIEIQPGVTHSVQWSIYVNGQYVGSQLQTPPRRDPTTVIELRATFKDQHGNLVADDTPVTWFDFDAFQDDTAVVENQIGSGIGTTKNGRSTLRVTADKLPSILNMMLRADQFESTTQLVGTELTVDVTFDRYIMFSDAGLPTAVVTATVTDALGRPAPDGTPISFFDSKNLITRSDTEVHNGVATATISVEGKDEIDVRGKVFVSVQAAGFYAKQHSGQFLQIDRLYHRAIGAETLSLSNNKVAGDVNGTVTTTLETLDGEAGSSTLANSTTAKLRNLKPDLDYRIRFIGNRDSTLSFIGGGTSTYEIGSGIVSVDVPIFSQGVSDRVQKVRLVLEAWDGTIFDGDFIGWHEVDSYYSTADIIVGEKDKLTNLEYAAAVATDFLYGAVFGSDDLDAGLAGDLALSLIPVAGVYTDVRDIAKSLWSLTPLSTREFDARELTIGVLGIVAEFAPPADLAVDGVRLVNKIAKGARLGQFLLAVEPLFQGMAVEVWENIQSSLYGSSSSSPQARSFSGQTAAASSTSSSSGIIEDLARVLGSIGPKSREAAQTMIAFASKIGNTTFTDAIRKITEVGGKRAATLLTNSFGKLGGEKIADALVNAAGRLNQQQLGHGVQALGLAIRGDNGGRILLALQSASADEIADIVVSLGKISAGGAAALSGDVAVLLPRLASTGLLNGSDATKSLTIIKQLTDDLAYIAERGDFNGLAAQMASIRGFYGPLGNRFPQFYGFLYEPTVARAYGQANPGETLQIVVRDSDKLGQRSLDALFGRTIVEAKHGIGDDKAKKRLLEQVKAYYASELGDKLVFTIPDEATKTAVKEFLKNTAVKDAALKEILESGFIDYQVVASPWKGL